jgi:RNase H-like domain found in reverse transcriptase/Reverse transcriptase (RNA-dependent DNA polymerase)/Integrase zinc binding domain/Chromo (CHRromatin Organisation MOdifier) domain/Retroviral aspartyl protease
MPFERPWAGRSDFKIATPVEETWVSSGEGDWTIKNPQANQTHGMTKNTQKHLHKKKEYLNECELMTRKVETQKKEQHCHHMTPHLEEQRSDLVYIDLLLNNKPCRALLDSGSTDNFISKSLVTRMGLQTQANEEQFRIKFADGRACQCDSVVSVAVSFQEMRETMIFNVAPLDQQLILGKTWLRKHNPSIDWVTNKVVLRTEEREDLHLISALQLKRMLSTKDQEGFLAVVTEVTKHEEQRPVLEPNAKLQALLAEHADIFPIDLPAKLPPSRSIDHRIEVLPDSIPPSRPTYRLSRPEMDELKRQIDELLKKEFIQPSKSPYGAPVLFIKKKDSGLRLCIDYRALNKQTIKNKCPIPRIDELLDRMKDARFFSKLDLKSGYHQIRISPDDVHKTAFRTRYGHFEYKVMSFGLVNAPATFTTLMNQVFHDLLDVCVVVYLDDILVFSHTEEEHLQHLETVLERLRSNKLYANPSKCEFLRTEIKYLGHVINAAGISADPDKIKAVREWVAPTSVADLLSFLGLANFYRKFIQDFALTTVPLTNLLKKGTPYQWTAVEEKAFSQLKDDLSSAPVLKVADPELSFRVTTDASDYALGAVLSQQEDGVDRPISFESRKLTPAEINYATHEKELLAIVHAIKTWRVHLEGNHFEVVTDHAALRFLQTQQILSRRQARWSELLQQYDFEIVYRPGKTNVVADALSRRPDYREPKKQVNSIQATVAPSNGLLKRIRTAYATDDHLSAIINRLNSVTTTPESSHNERFKLIEGLLYYENEQTSRLCVPQEPNIRLSILESHHDAKIAGHLGFEKTYDSLHRHYYWPRMAKDVRKFVETCATCQRNKPRNHLPYGELQPLPIPERRWESISMDLITQLPMTTAGHDAIVVFVDRLSKMAHFVPTITKSTAPELAKLFFDSVFRYHGLPMTVVSDRDPRFTSLFWKAVFKLVDTKLALSTAYHPQTDGQTERTNRTLEQMLRSYVNYRQDNWDTLLGPAEFAYNNAKQTATQMSPFLMVYGQHPRVPSSFLVPTPPVSNVRSTTEFLSETHTLIKIAKDNLQAAQEYQIKYANKSRTSKTFKVGERVFVSSDHLVPPSERNRQSKKLGPKFSGPYTITQVISPVNYKLDLPSAIRIHPVFHVSTLKSCQEDLSEYPGRVASTPPPIVHGDDDPEYEVDCVLDKRTRGSGRKEIIEYLVKWKGYPDHDINWQPSTNLANAQTAIRDYERLNSQSHSSIS